MTITPGKGFGQESQPRKVLPVASLSHRCGSSPCPARETLQIGAPWGRLSSERPWDDLEEEALGKWMEGVPKLQM